MHRINMYMCMYTHTLIRGICFLRYIIDILPSYLRLYQPLPENDIERINYILQLYDKMLDFLLSRGAYLIHISAQYLLNYNDYIISIDIVQSNVSFKLFIQYIFIFYIIYILKQYLYYKNDKILSLKEYI